MKKRISVDGFIKTPKKARPVTAGQMSIRKTVRSNRPVIYEPPQVPPAPVKSRSNDDLELKSFLKTLDQESESAKSSPEPTKRAKTRSSDSRISKLDKINQKRLAKGKKPLTSGCFWRRQIVKWVFLIIVLVCVGWTVLFLRKSLGHVSRLFRDGNLIGLIKKEKLQEDSSGRTNVLIFGTSPVNWDGSDLADSIMVVSLNQKTGAVYTVSLPRDLYVKHSCSGWLGTTAGKFNESYGCGKYTAVNQKQDEKAAEIAGQNEIKGTVETILGLDIQYVVHVNWQVLVETVDALGGIMVKVEAYDGSSEVYDVGTGLRYKHGEMVSMDGAIALKFSRARGSFGGTGLSGSNFDRERNQQKIIKAIAEKFKASSHTNISTMLGVFDALGNNIQTSFKTSELQTVVDIAKNINPDNFISLPLIGTDLPEGNLVRSGNIDGKSVVLPTEGMFQYNNIHKYIARKTLNGALDTQEEAKIIILNGTETAGLAGEQKTKLTNLGLNVVKIGNATSQDYPKTTIYSLNSQAPKTLAKLEQTYNTKAVTEANRESITQTDADILVIIGKD